MKFSTCQTNNLMQNTAPVPSLATPAAPSSYFNPASVLILISISVVSSILILLFALFVRSRNKRNRYNSRLHKPLFNDKIHHSPKRQVIGSSFVVGVPTILTSTRSPKRDPFLNILKTRKDALDHKITILSRWFLENEELEFKQKLHLSLQPGSIFKKVFPDSILSIDDSLLMKYDLLAIESIITSSIFSHLTKFSTNKTHLFATHLKKTNSLNIPRSIISLFDWELFGYITDHLDQGLKTIDTQNPFSELIDACQAEIFNNLKMVLPMTFKDLQDPTDKRTRFVLFNALGFSFLCLNFDPLCVFLKPVKGEKVDEFMDLSGNESIVEGCALMGVKSRDVLIKSLVF